MTKIKNFGFKKPFPYSEKIKKMHKPPMMDWKLKARQAKEDFAFYDKSLA